MIKTYYKMKLSSTIHIKKKKAYVEYHILDTYIAGIRLLGTEIKSIREGKAIINDAFCSFFENDLYIRNMHIAEYSHGSFYNHDAKRDRQLMLTQSELKKLKTKTDNRELTTVTLPTFITHLG